MLHHTKGACCIQHTVSWTARIIFSFVLFHLFNILICLKFYCHFSAITPNWNLTKKKALCSQFSTTKLIQCDIPQHSKLAQLVLLLTHIQEMPSSNLSKHDTYPNSGVSWFYPLPPPDTNTVPQIMPNHFFPPLFQFTVYWSPNQNLTFKGRMLRLRHAACIPWWPNVTFT